MIVTTVLTAMLVMATAHPIPQALEAGGMYEPLNDGDANVFAYAPPSEDGRRFEREVVITDQHVNHPIPHQIGQDESFVKVPSGNDGTNIIISDHPDHPIPHHAHEETAVHSKRDESEASAAVEFAKYMHSEDHLRHDNETGIVHGEKFKRHHGHSHEDHDHSHEDHDHSHEHNLDRRSLREFVGKLREKHAHTDFIGYLAPKSNKFVPTYELDVIPDRALLETEALTEMEAAEESFQQNVKVTNEGFVEDLEVVQGIPVVTEEGTPTHVDDTHHSEHLELHKLEAVDSHHPEHLQPHKNLDNLDIPNAQNIEEAVVERIPIEEEVVQGVAIVPEDMLDAPIDDPHHAEHLQMHKAEHAIHHPEDEFHHHGLFSRNSEENNEEAEILSGFPEKTVKLPIERGSIKVRTMLTDHIQGFAMVPEDGRMVEADPTDQHHSEHLQLHVAEGFPEEYIADETATEASVAETLPGNADEKVIETDFEPAISNLFREAEVENIIMVPEEGNMLEVSENLPFAVADGQAGVDLQDEMDAETLVGQLEDTAGVVKTDLEYTIAKSEEDIEGIIIVPEEGGLAQNPSGDPHHPEHLQIHMADESSVDHHHPEHLQPHKSLDNLIVGEENHHTGAEDHDIGHHTEGHHTEGHHPVGHHAEVEGEVGALFPADEAETLTGQPEEALEAEDFEENYTLKENHHVGVEDHDISHHTEGHHPVGHHAEVENEVGAVFPADEAETLTGQPEEALEAEDFEAFEEIEEASEGGVKTMTLNTEEAGEADFPYVGEPTYVIAGTEPEARESTDLDQFNEPIISQDTANEIMEEVNINQGDIAAVPIAGQDRVDEIAEEVEVVGGSLEAVDHLPEAYTDADFEERQQIENELDVAESGEALKEKIYRKNSGESSRSDNSESDEDGDDDRRRRHIGFPGMYPHPGMGMYPGMYPHPMPYMPHPMPMPMPIHPFMPMPMYGRKRRSLRRTFNNNGEDEKQIETGIRYYPRFFPDKSRQVEYYDHSMEMSPDTRHYPALAIANLLSDSTM